MRKTILKKVILLIFMLVIIIFSNYTAITITILGIQYMSAAPNERAEIKSKLINFTIGVGTVVTATETIKMFRDFAQQHVN